MVYTNEEGIECTDCEFRKERPGAAFGHTRCLAHRLCTGFKYWEPTNCRHCSNLDSSLKDLEPHIRLAQMGKLKTLLKEVQRKVGEIDSIRDWKYEPIFEFKKYHFSQATQHEQVNDVNSPPLDHLIATSPIDFGRVANKQ